MTEIIKVNYTGRIKDGEVFDTTFENVAKEHKIHAPNFVYAAAPVILGEGNIIKGLEEALKDMKEGENKTILVPPEKAFGNRDNKLVRLLPIKVFKDNKVNPFPGMSVNLEGGLIGKVRSVSGGRVQVDFNHELAGKTLEYDMTVVKKAKDDNEKMEWISEIVFPKHKIKLEKKDKEITIGLPKEVKALRDLGFRKNKLVELLKKHIKVDSVKITEEY